MINKIHVRFIINLLQIYNSKSMKIYRFRIKTHINLYNMGNFNALRNVAKTTFRYVFRIIQNNINMIVLIAVIGK